MADALIEIPVLSMPGHKLWTREEVEAIVAAGIDLTPFELVEGELIDRRMGKNNPHIIAVRLIFRWLAGIFGLDCVQKEDPIDVAVHDNVRNAPEPDITVLAPGYQFGSGYPGPDDVRLVVEVAASTLSFDLRIKAPLYARAGFQEYWVLDVANRRLIVHREPRDGQYQSVLVYKEGASVAPLAAPNALFAVKDAFPPLTR